MWNDQGGFNQGGGFDGQGGLSSPGGFGTPQQGEERKGRSRAQHIVPVNVAQVLNASVVDDRFYSGSLEISQIILVGLIRSVKETTTRIDYELDDMSGPLIEVKQWVDNDPLLVTPDDMNGPLLDVKQWVDNDENVPDEERVATMRENSYVRVCGHVRTFQGKRNVVAFSVRPLEDLNQLTCHLLGVIYAHAATDKATDKQSTTATSGNQRSVTTGTSNAGDFGGPNHGMSALHNQIANIIKSCNSEMGASIADVSRHLKGIPEKSIRDAVEFLSGEGHIYSTIDDDHFKATDG